jgi:hypothetical protein
MSIYILAAGTLVADPQSREGAKGPFTCSGPYNVAIATGAVSGVIVLDIDPRNGGDASLARRPRRCCVYENIDRGFHLLLIDDGGGLILAQRVDDLEAAAWLAALVSAALASAFARRSNARRVKP